MTVPTRPARAGGESGSGAGPPLGALRPHRPPSSGARVDGAPRPRQRRPPVADSPPRRASPAVSSSCGPPPGESKDIAPPRSPRDGRWSRLHGCGVRPLRGRWDRGAPWPGTCCRRSTHRSRRGRRGRAALSESAPGADSLRLPCAVSRIRQLHPSSRPWSFGRGKGRPRAGMSMGVSFAERVVVLRPWRPWGEADWRVLGARRDWRGSWGLPGHVARNGALNPSCCGSSAQGSARGAALPSPRVGIAPCPVDRVPSSFGDGLVADRAVARSVATIGPGGDSTLSAADPSGAAHDGRPTGTRRGGAGIEGPAPRPGAASSRPRGLEPAPLVAERVLRTASRSHGVSGWRCLLPVLVEIHQLVLRGRARGHVGGPKGRPRSGCRPKAVPGPACPWACCSRSAWWCVVGSRRSLDGVGRRVLGARSRWRGSRGLPGHLARNRRGSIPVVADPRRKASGPGRRTPFASGGIAPNRTVHRDATDGGLVRRSVRSASRRLRPLGLIPLERPPLTRRTFCARAHVT